MPGNSELNIALVGCGTVGSGVVRIVQTSSDLLTQRTGRSIRLRRVVVRDLAKKRDVDLSGIPVSDDIQTVIADPDIQAVIHVVGGINPARADVTSLLESGISAMKIWPMDPIAKESGGHSITAEQLRRGLEPLRLIKKEFGDRMDVAMEFHGFWNLPCAIRIARACEEYEPMWLEEMLPQDNLAAYRELATATHLPLTISERLMTRWQYRELFENRAARTVMPDISWVGGLSEARKIANMAETWYLPAAPHNCGGPVLHAASLHLAANLTNLQIVESVRRHYADEYTAIVGELARPREGYFDLPPGPGLGVDLAPGVFKRPDLIRRETIG